MWHERGFLLDTVTGEEWSTGGKWIIGDGQSDGHPGKTDRFHYKSWELRSPAGIGRMFPPVGFHGSEGRVYLCVLSSSFSWVTSGGESELDAGSTGDCRWIEVDLRSSGRQLTWEEPVVRGFTFAANETGRSVVGGVVGDQYEVRTWDLRTISRLSQPEYLGAWTLQCVEVFAGEVLCRISTEPLFPEIYPIGPGLDSRHSHVFLRHDITRSWEKFAQQARGVVLYLNLAP